ncbi:CBS domain-containing protein [Deinococcus koreensis]|nr:CBS domain-containing protein [Deinococcus koreensis]
MLVRDLMSAQTISAPPSLPLTEAARLLQSHGIRRLPVVEEGQLVGIVSDRDLREALPSTLSTLSMWEATTRLASLRVADIMKRNVLTTTPDADARDAAHTLLEHRVGALPVIDGTGQVVGLLSVSDVLRDYARPAAATPVPELTP